MLDRFVYGTVDRISPEAPIPILKVNRDYYTLGGAGNVVRNLSSLGCKTTFVGVVGKDEAGERVNNLLKALPHVTVHLTTEGRTPFKSRFISQSQQLLRVDDEIVLHPSSITVDNLMSVIAESFSSIQGVILSDYGKGSLPPKLCQFVIASAKAAGIPVLVDPKGQDYRRYQGATVLTPNAKELSEAIPYGLRDDEDFAKAIRYLKDSYQVDSVLVTRGAKGMVVAPDTQENLIHIPAQACEVFDVSGAGDTVIATLSAAIALGKSLEEAAHLANIAGGIVVGKVGTAVITPNELEAGILKTQVSTPFAKIMSLDSAKSYTQTWRRQGLTIGFTNGCFDLLHLGHLHILKQSKNLCDRLIVGLNSDDSVKRLKGENRPIQGEIVRAQVLAALEYVDGVVLFDDKTPLSLIESLLPDVLCKGADYTIDQVVGANVVQLHGGKVHLVDLKPGHSTTLTVHKLRGIA